MATNPLRNPQAAEDGESEQQRREREEEEESLDRTIEDSFPASDPPSTIPDPHEDEGAA
jgi:hypothetical protein